MVQESVPFTALAQRLVPAPLEAARMMLVLGCALALICAKAAVPF